MEPKRKEAMINTISLICGVWFSLTSWLWPWLFNLFISLPVGIVGMILWSLGRSSDKQNKWNKVALVLHGIGLASAIISFFLFYFFN
jgi:hypothetical protein